MRSWMIAFSLAVAIVCHLPMRISWYESYVFLLIGVLSGLLFVYNTEPRIYRITALGLSAVALGGFYGVVSTHYLSDNLLAEQWNKHTWQLTGVVSSLPVISTLSPDERLNRFIFIPEQAPQQLPDKVQLSWVQHYKQAPIIPGARYQLSLRLVRPQQLRNPHMRDSEFWFVANKVGAKGYVVEGLYLEEAESLSSALLRLRYKASNYIQQQALLSGKRFIPALLVGDKSLLSNDDWQLFTATGTVHLLIISGLHVGVIGGLFWFVVGGFGRILCVNQYYRWRWLRLLSTLLGLWLFVIFAGAELAAMRAGVMASVLFLFATWQRQNQWFNGLIVAWFVLTLIDPMLSWSAGFYFSFGIVLLLLLSQQGRYYKASRTSRWLQPQMLAFLCSRLVLLAYSREVSLISPAANLIAIPLVTLLILPLSMLSMGAVFVSEKLATLLLGVSSALFDLLLWILTEAEKLNQWLMQLTASYLHDSNLNEGRFVIAIVVSILLLALLPKKILPRTPVIIFIAALLTLNPTNNINNYLYLTVFDVGQGLSLLIKGADKSMLYDTGPGWSNGSSVMQRLIATAIKKQKVSELDWLVVSHGDNDHSGGAASAIKTFVPKQIIAGEPKRLAKQIDGLKPLVVNPCKSLHANNSQWQIKTYEIPIKTNSNNDSCVVKIRWGNASVLLTGDIDSEAESYLLKTHRESLKADVLIIPHHGSKTSSSIGLLNWVKPKVAVVSTGYMNRFHHPVKKVMLRYQRRNIPVLNTAYEGAVSIRINSITGKIEVTSQRRDKPYFWDRPLKPLPQWLHHGG